MERVYGIVGLLHYRSHYVNVQYMVYASSCSPCPVCIHSLSYTWFDPDVEWHDIHALNLKKKNKINKEWPENIWHAKPQTETDVGVPEHLTFSTYDFECIIEFVHRLKSRVLIDVIYWIAEENGSSSKLKVSGIRFHLMNEHVSISFDYILFFFCISLWLSHVHRQSCIEWMREEENWRITQFCIYKT